MTSWRLDVPALVFVLLVGATYLAGVRRLRRSGQQWRAWPKYAFGLGLGSVVVVTMSSLGVYDRVLFWPRAVQYTVLLGVSPLLLAMGEPLDLARACLHGRSRHRLDAVLRSRNLRVLAFPPVGAVLGASTLMALFLTPLYDATLTSTSGQRLVWLGLILIGCVFFVPELDPGEEMLPAWCGYGVRVMFSFVDGLLDALPGVVIMTMHSTIAAGSYATTRPTWAPSLHWDQLIGGGLMFTIAEAGALPYLLVLMIRWIREDERTARDIDLHLDREAAQNSPNTDPAGQAMRPWWETDPVGWTSNHGSATRPTPDCSGASIPADP